MSEEYFLLDNLTQDKNNSFCVDDGDHDAKDCIGGDDDAVSHRKDTLSS